MNISTGGPHILLFERDQQLAVLLTSELQLTGYECHIARTAVEVFDAIARFPVRLVLVNLAQAAASRREFWVALDTQRRGSGIQVFTFHCSNLAGYGPRDPDDYSQASMADMEIDGMVGLMKLVDTIRARVPSAEGNATTAPRIPRSSMPNEQPEPIPSTSNRTADSDNTWGQVSRSAVRPLPQPQMNTTSTSAIPTSQGTLQSHIAASPATQLPGGNQATYSDKIRAVLYPNPHSPNPHATVGIMGNNGVSPRYGSYAEPDTSRSYSPQVPPLPANPTVSSGASVLQRLANGQIYSSPGLAELSRLVDAYRSSDIQEHSNQQIAHQSRGTEGMRSSPNMRIEQVSNNTVTYTSPDQSNDHLGIRNPMPPLPQTETNKRERGRDYQVGGSAQTETTASSSAVLRAAPIQDLPLERSAGNQSGYGMAIKPPDGISRAKETLSSQPPGELPFPTQPPLASMTTSSWPIEPSSPTSLNAPPSAPVRSVEQESRISREKATAPLTTEPPYQRAPSEPPRRSDRSQEPPYQREPSEPPRQFDRSQKREHTERLRPSDRSQEPPYQRAPSEPPRRSDRSQEPPYQREHTERLRPSDRSQEPPYQRAPSEPSRRSDRSQEPPYQREHTERLRPSDRSQEPPHQREPSEPPRRSDRSQEPPYQREPSEPPRRSDRSQEPPHQLEPSEPPRRSDRSQEPPYQREPSEPPRRSDRSQEPPYQLEPSEPPRRSDRSQEPPHQLEPSERLRPSDRSQEPPHQLEPSEPPRRSDRSQEPPYQREPSEPPRRSDRSQEPPHQLEHSEPPQQADHSQEPFNLREEIERLRQSDRSQEPPYQREPSEPPRQSDRSQESLYQSILQGKDIDESTDARNAVILDILQSLPAIATPSDQQEQAVQPQVHNGRATRSLGNVLLDGHLVPQDRLEVAQNIQRMLRGVDMNYQLGEILLMFKLLTPDQLLAASLVGYGLITRTQISALGRIRQELHAIGLEYDLENLVILFRILTPEQLREARSSVLG